MQFGSTRVLGNWQPEFLDTSFIENQFPQIVRKLIGSYRARYLTVRDPNSDNVGIGAISEWHQDGNEDYYFILWSQTRPTEIQFKDGSLLPTKDGDVVLINNHEVQHRRPPMLEGRWFARISYLERGAFTGEFSPAI